MADIVRTLYAALMVLSSVASVCGNLVLLLALLLNKELWSDSVGLTLSFSLSDLALGLSTIPFGVYNSLSWPVDYSSSSSVCQGSAFIFLLLQTSSIHSLTWTTVDRFTEICFALSYQSLWTSRRSRAVLVLVWLSCLVSATLPLLGFGSYTYSEWRFLCCPSFSPDNRYFVVLWMVVGVVAPVVTMCSLNGYIVYVARKQARRGTFKCNELHCFYVPANNYLRSSVVMVTTSACLLVCWLPFICVSLYETFSGQQSPPLSSTLSTWLVLTSASLNPWITCMTQTRYRAAARRTISWFRSPCPGTSHPQSPALQLDTTQQVNTTPAAAPPSSIQTQRPGPHADLQECNLGNVVHPSISLM